MMQPRVDSAVIMTGLRQSSNPHGSRESIMLWCIPHSLFPRNKRQTSAIKEKLDAMDAYQGEGASNLGALYLAANKSERGKLRRPHPVSISSPLDDNFDAISQDETLARGYGTRKGESGATRTPSPREDGRTYVGSPTLKGSDPSSSWNRSHAPYRMQQDGTKKAGSTFRDARKGIDIENYGEYGAYMNEMERMFGGSVDLALSVRRTGREQPQNEALQLGRVKSHGTSQEEHVLGGRATFQNHHPPSDPLTGRGPRAGDNYEITSHRILEDTPERTVTIATWRERVARETAADVDSKSVYYVGPDDYLGNGNECATETETQSGSTSRAKLEKHRTGYPPSETHRAVGSGELPQEHSREKPKHTESEERLTPPHSRQIPTRISGPLTKGSTKLSSWVEASPPRSSTPIRSNTVKTRRQEEPNSEVSPEKSESLPSPFHPTESGSIISTIKSASTLALEEVLDSCEPSLVHIAPVLAGLGITKEEHLRAVRRLSEETRDRQLKEEALRLGVTVMEWAILLDKIQEL